MSDSQPSGFRGFLWAVAAVWAGAAGPSIAGWLFPSVDDFFAKSGRVISGIWSFLTTTWSVPAIPLLLGIAIAALGVLIMLARIQSLAEQVKQTNSPPSTASSRPNLAAQFNKAEWHILVRLLHAHGNKRDADDVVNSAHPTPPLVVQEAAQSLINQGLLVHQRNYGGYGYDFLLTPAGKELMLQAWRAENE